MFLDDVSTSPCSVGCCYFELHWFPTGEKFLTREEFPEFWEGISASKLSDLFIASAVLVFQVDIGSFN